VSTHISTLALPVDCPVKISNLGRRLLRNLNFLCFLFLTFWGGTYDYKGGGSNLSDKGLNLSGSW
ncbi:unnamed protein product, partial [Brassica oleracea]